MTERHKGDVYGSLAEQAEQAPGVAPPIPSATVVLLRDASAGPEVLMLRKNSEIAFGGMWVFPGGKIDDVDRAAADDEFGAAQLAAARETREETGLSVEPRAFTWFARWTPPPAPRKRFTTWFFAAEAGDVGEVTIDDGEIKDHAWINPGDALVRHRKGEIDLVPPTWVTLYHLSRYAPSSTIVEHFRANQPKFYSTRVAKNAEGVRVAMWHGDAGYETLDALTPGPRHRLVMAPDGFVFENDIESY